MNVSPAHRVDEAFRRRVGKMHARDRPPVPDSYREVFAAQIKSRHLDLVARLLQEQGRGFYTIGSSGHEGNAAVADALRPSDPALLHYRSGAFFLRRARLAGVDTAVRDILCGIVAAREDPASGGRHKVFGSSALSIIPTTSTIASHLPRALGVGFAIERARKLGLPSRWPRDAVVVCSFGDASVNHSTAVGALNAAAHATYQGLRLPVVFVCEDNGIGISVRSPAGWVEQRYGHHVGLEFLAADGCDLADAMLTSARAVDWARKHRRPVFLHLRTVRLMGHAGSDVETAYRGPAEIADDLARDPLVHSARVLVESGALTREDVLSQYEAARAEVLALAEEVAQLPALGSAEEVTAPLQIPRSTRTAPPRGAATGPRLTLAQAINRTLADILQADPGALVFGQDVASKGGVYGVTRGLAKRFGGARVFDTLLDEQTILGLGLGAATSGMLPIPEIQYLAYLHNAADQLRGEAATMTFFSDGQYTNPMVVRVAGYAYQKGFGGHFHNDNSITALRDIPGLLIASPARPDDASALLHACVQAARRSGACSVFMEPIALYHTRDLVTAGDDGWLGRVADASEAAPIGRARVYGEGTDLALVTYANGVRMSLRVAERLERRGIGCRVVDLRWISPLPVDDVVTQATATGRVLVVDEGRRSGGVGEPVLAALVDHGYTGAMARVASHDSFVPLGGAADHVLLGEAEIESAAHALAYRELG